MTFVKTLAVGTLLATTLVAGTAFAKGHDQGFGNQTAGPATSGLVDNSQRNSPDVRTEGDARSSAYGIRDTLLEVRAGTQDNSEVARMRDGSHPSQTKGN